MTILLTGGTGKTSTPLANLLRDSKIPFLLTSRRDVAEPHFVRFDWTDPSTFGNPFSKADNITAIYLVGPEIADPFIPMNEFVEFAVKEHGVKRFVLMAGSDGPGEGNQVGKVWQKLLDLGVEYCVLHGNWFMDNMSENFHTRFLTSIKEEKKIYTAAGDAKLAFISALDIARVAFRGLIDEKPHNTDYWVDGPELLSYDQVAEKLTRCLGAKVQHVKLNQDDRAKQMMGLGTPEPFARFLAGLEARFAGMPERPPSKDVEKVTGQQPQSFDSFAEEHKAIWL
ncbi:hypothetical protein V5O48_005282 [Marasmius crinis-equi]|uniref:NAD(P)-binding domain-containing protein n=1 Tax=Marasmius crinis-equi TaxID=585013 RepID=A0ABR3FN57_9AGAR